jgi:hypothetical protein
MRVTGIPASAFGQQRFWGRKGMNFQLEGKTAVVTGSTAGIRLAIAEAPAAEGGAVRSILQGVEGQSLPAVERAGRTG